MAWDFTKGFYMTDKKIIGLCGFPKTGKALIALKIAEKKGIKLITVPEYDDFGSRAKAGHLSVKAKLRLYNEALDSGITSYYLTEGKVSLISQTPIDLMANALFEFGKHDLSTEDYELFKMFRARCVGALNRFFSDMIFLQKAPETGQEDQLAVLTRSFLDYMKDTSCYTMVEHSDEHWVEMISQIVHRRSGGVYD